MLKPFWSAVLAGLLLHGSAQAQVMTTNPNLKSSTTVTSCSGDKIQLIGFTMTPSNPAVNQNVTVKIDMRNLCGTTLNIPYKIANGSGVVTSGTKSVSAKQTASVQYSWKATAGNHSFDAYLDENNAINEASSYRLNNGAQDVIAFTVTPQPPAVAMLDGFKARDAGAMYVSAPIKGPCMETSIFPGSQLVAVNLNGYPGCEGGVYDLHKNLVLKNGWKVKAVDVTGASTNATWEWITRPVNGSTSPYGRLRIKPVLFGPTIGAFSVRITIEGPQGTNPYE